MTVTVVLVSSLRKYSRPETPGEWKGQISEGSRLADLAREIGIPDALAKSATIDGTLAGPDAPLSSGVQVMFFPQVSGG